VAPTRRTARHPTYPEYAQPYVEQMLGAAQKQIFDYEKDAEGNLVPTTMKGFKPFNADPNAYFAGFQPLQERAFQGAREMQVRPETQDAAGLAGRVGLSAVGTTYDPLRAQSQQFGQDQAQQYMSPYMQSVVDIQQAAAQRQADIAGTSRGAQAVQAGAFGGSRQAIMDAEAARALADQKALSKRRALQSAYSQAQQQFNADQAWRACKPRWPTLASNSLA
jgi:hypothetical protein